MQKKSKTVLLVSMPFAAPIIPSIQLSILEGYCRERGIKITSKHLYLQAANIYGLSNYLFLISPPNDSYLAQMFFSKYVFPDHWEKTKNKLEQYFTDKISKKNQGSFQDIVQMTDTFYQWTLQNIDWKSYDIIGFSLNYGQFLPSLAVAKEIKSKYPDKMILFGGSRTIGQLGKNILKAFDYVDCIVSGEGEEPLYRLASDYQNIHTIPGVIYKNRNKIVWNQTEKPFDINSNPLPSYDSFYTQLQTVCPDIRHYFSYYGRLPVEISRGCWWNKCTFCNLNIQYQNYREKQVDNIVKEIEWLANSYKILDFHLIGNTLPKDYKTFLQRIKEIGMDLTFFVEARAGRLHSTDYQLLKEAGITSIQTGVESFSPHYLKVMNKGTRVIDNIAALKWCTENDISNKYNLIIHYPNEESIDYEETKHNIQFIKQYLEPPSLCQLRVVFGNDIYNFPEHYNVKSLTTASIDKLMFPQEILEKEINFVYEFTKKKDLGSYDWEGLIEDWKTDRQQRELEAVKTKNPLDKYVFYYVDGGSFVKIYDKRSLENIMIYGLDQTEREVFLSCIDVISYSKLQEKLPHIQDHDLAAILHTFEENGIVYREDYSYLSLPLSYRILTSKTLRIEEEVCFA